MYCFIAIALSWRLFSSILVYSSKYRVKTAVVMPHTL